MSYLSPTYSKGSEGLLDDVLKIDFCCGTNDAKKASIGKSGLSATKRKEKEKKGDKKGEKKGRKGKKEGKKEIFLTRHLS